MKKLLFISLIFLTLGACAPSVYVNENGQAVRACTTDFECMQKNGF